MYHHPAGGYRIKHQFYKDRKQQLGTFTALLDTISDLNTLNHIHHFKHTQKNNYEKAHRNETELPQLQHHRRHQECEHHVEQPFGTITNWTGQYICRQPQQHRTSIYKHAQ